MAQSKLVFVLFLFPLFSSAFSTTDTLSFPLYYIEYSEKISNSSDPDYKAFIRARLQHYQAQVNAVAARLELDIADSRAECTPSPSANLGRILSMDSEEGAFSTPTVSGRSQGGYSQYLARLSIGQPPRSVFMVIDTGSDLSWIQSKPCNNCHRQSGPIYDPSTSSTFSPFSCSSQQCMSLNSRTCRNSRCVYKICYGDKSYTVGELGSESISFKGSNSLYKVAFGCGHHNKQEIYPAAGVLGLGGGSLSFPSQIKAKNFSFCLVDRDSNNTSTLDFGSNIIDQASISVPLLKNPKLQTLYYVNMTGISIGGEMLPIPLSAFVMDTNGRGGTIIDSGSTLTILRADVYNLTRDAFVKGMRNLTKVEGAWLFDTCYNLSLATNMEVPDVSFHFAGGKELRLPKKNSLVPLGSNETSCFAFVPTSKPLLIIGNVQLQGTRVAFDLVNSVVWFTHNKC